MNENKSVMDLFGTLNKMATEVKKCPFLRNIPCYKKVNCLTCVTYQRSVSKK